MQDRMMEEIEQDIAHIEDTLERHKKRVRRVLPNEAEAAVRRSVNGNKRYTPPRTR